MQQAQGSLYSSPFSLSQPAMQPQALQVSGMQPLASQQSRPLGSSSGFRRSKQVASTRSEPPQGHGISRGGKGKESGGEVATKSLEEVEQPKKRAESSKEKIADLRKKQPAEKKDPSPTPADKSDQAASTEGKKQSRGQRRRENERKKKAELQREKEAKGEKGEGVSGNTEAMDVDEEVQALTSTGPNDGGGESSREAEVSTLAIRERSSEGDPQPQASKPADNSVLGTVDGDGAAPGPSEPRQPEL